MLLVTEAPTPLAEVSNGSTFLFLGESVAPLEEPKNAKKNSALSLLSKALFSSNAY